GLDSGYFANISGMIPQLDPTYVEDFWSKPGYLGAAGDSALQQARFSIDSTVLGCEAGPPFTFMLADAPDRDCSDAHLVVLSGRAAGASLPVERSDGHRVRLIMTADASAAGAIRPGDRVRLDNAWTLALQTYHRHQVPDDTAYLGWNQFRGDDGAPIYPQRDVQIGPFGTVTSAGSLLDGKINGKVLLLAALLDIDSFPWQAHWYRQEIRKHLGDTFTDHCAIWFIDNAHHENPLDALQRAHVVSFRGALQQGLRDLARWVEEGVRPPDTRYTIENAQVLLPARASDRGGIQPVISLAANGKQRADIAVGETVHFTATIEVPPGAGKVVSAQWDFGGAGDFPVTADIGAPAERVTLIACHRYDTPGTRFPALRVAAQREGNPDTPYALVENIALVRVVIS
ncbi:MAG: hypothetical protein N2423_05805, partial [Novosphingobium sp.]|nr:hypothetical protein [Novosphingobium sp.]